LANSPESNNFAENNSVNNDNNKENKNLPSLEGLAIINTPKHDFKNIAEAKSWAKENITGIYHNMNTGEDISVSKSAINKYLSEKTVTKSVSLDAHLSALKQLPKLIKTSILTERTPDKNESQSIIEIQRLYGKINYNGNTYPVKTTVKVVRNEGSRAYSYEVMEIESPTENLSGNSNQMGLRNGAQYTTNPDFSPIEERSPSTHNRQSVTDNGTSESQNKGTNIFKNNKCYYLKITCFRMN
jgi:hypothetical protein